jgi:serine/threonine protein kinase
MDRDELYGRTVGEFVLRERIGEGGFGAVYRCEQPTLGREAVIKVLHHRLRGNDVVRQRFLREARLASRLDHPYAAHVYAFGVERIEGMFWIAMEMVHGTTLGDWLDEHGPLPLERLVPFFECVAEVVHTAHERGIVHRDLKPSNIMVIERAGRLLPKLLDFGIAKMLDDTPVPGATAPASAEHTETLTNTGDPAAATMPDRPHTLTGDVAPPPRREAIEPAGLTRSNATLGSPPYMSPEQWGNPLRVGPRSDLYALGVIAYQALTGRRPFSARSASEFAELHCRAEVPLVGPGLPTALDPLFRRALAKRLEDRPATALELAEELRAASGLTGTRSQLQRTVRRRRPWLALGAVAVLAAAGAVTAVLAIGSSRDGNASREVPSVAAGSARSAGPLAGPLAASPAGPLAGSPVAAAPAPVPAAPSAHDADGRAAAAAPPATVAVHVESSPAGAEVFRWPSEIKVGVTPWDGRLPYADGVAVFVVKKRGHVDQRIELDLRTGARTRVALPRVTAPVHSPASAEPRRKGEPADPFKGALR